MTRHITRTVLGAVIGLFAMAVPGYSSLVLTFATTAAGGTATINSSDQITALSGVVFNEFNDGGAENTTLSATLNTCVATMYGCGSTNDTTVVLWGTDSGLGINTAEALVTFNLSSALTTATPTLNVSFAHVTSVSVAANLLSDLGITNVTGTSFNSAGITGGAFATPTGSNTVNVTATSETAEVNVATATPEPSSWLLMGTALLGIAFFGRRKALKA